MFLFFWPWKVKAARNTTAVLSLTCSMLFCCFSCSCGQYQVFGRENIPRITTIVLMIEIWALILLKTCMLVAILFVRNHRTLLALIRLSMVYFFILIRPDHFQLYYKTCNLGAGGDSKSIVFNRLKTSIDST